MAGVPFHTGVCASPGGYIHRALPLPPQGLRGERRLLSRFQALEERFEALEAEVSRWELRRGMAGGEPPSGDVVALLEGLVSRRDAGLKEHLRAEVTSHLQVRGAGGTRGGGGTRGWAPMFPPVPHPAG